MEAREEVQTSVGLRCKIDGFGGGDWRCQSWLADSSGLENLCRSTVKVG